MAYADVTIKEYVISSVCQHHQERLNRSRQLTLLPASVEGDPVNGVFLWFLENHPPETGAGYYNPDNGWLLARAPLSDFETMYHIVQTEKSAMFRFFADENNQIVWFLIATGPELPGEGTGKTAEETLKQLDLLK